MSHDQCWDGKVNDKKAMEHKQTNIKHMNTFYK